MPMVILALLMMLQLLNIQELQSILIGFLKGKNLHGQTLHTPSMHTQFPSTENQQLSIQKMLHLIALSHTFEFDLNIAWVHWKADSNVYTDYNIDSNSDHVKACHWITIAIILHNLVIDVEGGDSVGQFGDIHRQAEEEVDRDHMKSWMVVAPKWLVKINANNWLHNYWQLKGCRLWHVIRSSKG